jgi:hypothetical protein
MLLLHLCQSIPIGAVHFDFIYEILHVYILNVCYVSRLSDLFILISPIKCDKEVFKSEDYTEDIKVLIF